MTEKTYYGVALVALVTVGMGAGPHVLDKEALAVHGSVMCNSDLIVELICPNNEPDDCTNHYRPCKSEAQEQSIVCNYQFYWACTVPECVSSWSGLKTSDFCGPGE